MKHYPKGSMCRSCKHRMRDCSALDFKSMPPIVRATEDGERVRYVKCLEFESVK